MLCRGLQWGLLCPPQQWCRQWCRQRASMTALPPLPLPPHPQDAAADDELLQAIQSIEEEQQLGGEAQ